MDLGDYASTYGGMGLEVFPADPQTKSPIISQYEATTDLDKIAAWWEKWPNALIAHRVNANTIILDIDPRHGGAETWKALDKLRGVGEASRIHYSGRDDGGMHLWFERPDGALTTKELDRWAKERGVGHNLKGRWTAGIDIIQRDHRYTILPPSPHPVTGKAYFWAPGKSFSATTGPLSPTLVPLVTKADTNGDEPRFRTVDEESIADWYSENHTLYSLLTEAGWQCVEGTGDDDGSRWQHPTATSDTSATVSNGCLFVYSTSTVFEPTEPGAPVGYTPFRVFATLHHGGDLSEAARAARKLHPGTSTGPDAQAGTQGDSGANPSMFVDWSEFWKRDPKGEDWLHDDVLAHGRGHAIYAKHGTGKSLFVLWVAAQVATTRDDVDVLYLDYEMTEDDLRERVEAYGYDETSDFSRLHYALLPFLPPLDTSAGREALMELVGRFERPHVLVVIDTMGRATEGEENSNDTARNFYRHSGMALKAAGCTWVRVDHAGKDATKGQRGGSSKGDDVDVVWKLSEEQGGKVALKREKARMGWVREKVEFTKLDDPYLTYRADPKMYTSEASRLARELDRLGVTVDTGVAACGRALRGAGISGSQKAVSDAVKLRRDPVKWPPKDSYKPLEPSVTRHVTVICPDDVTADVTDADDDL